MTCRYKTLSINYRGLWQELKHKAKYTIIVIRCVGHSVNEFLRLISIKFEFFKAMADFDLKCVSDLQPIYLTMMSTT